MKRFITLLFLCLFTAGICVGCGSSGENEAGKTEPGQEDAKKISVVSTIFAPYDFTRAVVGENADIKMLLPPGSESHSYEPTPQDIIAIQECDVFIYVGGESDGWVDGVLDSMDTSKMKIITLMDCVEVVEEDVVEGMEEEEEHSHDADEAGEDHHDDADAADEDHHDDADAADEDHHDDADAADEDQHDGEEPAYDEHVWTSPRNAKLIVQKLSDAFCEANPADANTYKENTTAYLAKLDELDGKFKAVVNDAVRKTIVFGDRFPFRYFADAYGLTYFAAFPGCSTDTEPSAATVKFLIDKVKEEKIPVVFHIEFGNEDMANSISEATGAKVLLFHACHNISKDDLEAGKTYLDLMGKNVDALKEALQ